MIRWSIFLVPIFAFAQMTIEEKKQELSRHEGTAFPEEIIHKINVQLSQKRQELYDLYAKASQSDLSSEGDFEQAKQSIFHLRREIRSLEDQWYQVNHTPSKGESYGLWNGEDVPLSQFVMEYGSLDHLYIVPPEVASQKIYLHSDLPIPKGSWSELVEIVLTQNGIGVRDLNRYVRQLYVMKQDFLSVTDIVAEEKAVNLIRDHGRLLYVLSPLPEHTKGVAQFFERFRDQKSTSIYQIDHKVLIVAPKEEVQKLIKLYKTVWNEGHEKISKIVTLTKMGAKEMEKIIKAYFDDSKNKITLTRGQSDELLIMPIASEGSLALVGVKELVEKAAEIVRNTELQINDPCEMTIYWYTCKHSDPNEICNVLEKVYTSLICAKPSQNNDVKVDVETMMQPLYPEYLAPSPYGPPAPPPVVASPPVVAPTIDSQKQFSQTNHFIPYPTTGSVMMVVRRDTLGQLKDLLRKLDIPKKMVQVEVLLCEKVVNNQNNFGLNLLRIGANAKHIRQTGLDYEYVKTKGILEFFMSRPSFKHFPAFDLAYNFLMSQQDVRINASPSILTINQTPGKFSNVEELSINNGAAPLETSSGITFENSYVRSQFGIVVVVTPTIHEMLENEDSAFITLETSVEFDTTKDIQNDRPIVNRRQIENKVRVRDGETVILGGLQRKIAEDSREIIPFLGELPWIGKFFSTTVMSDKTTEMFLFLTPKIIPDQRDEFRKVRDEKLRTRPGDVPEFYERIEEAKNWHKRKLFQNSIRLLFGSADD